jgi:two-component system, NtrC family, sensor kinase
LQILINLVRNSIQSIEEANPSRRVLTVRINEQPGGERIAISVSATGMGIEPDNLMKIFQHGFTTKRDGHGFGLHSAALAAREMKGDLSVQSDGPGRGATFTLELPKRIAG